MAEYSSSSLWTDEPSHCMVDLEALPLSEPTKEGLRAWSERLDESLDALSSGVAYDHEPDLREGRRLWDVVREELGDDYDVGYAFSEPDPWDRYSAIKRIVWDPGEAPTVEEELAGWGPDSSVSDEEYERIWSEVIADAADYCDAEAEKRDRRSDPRHGAYRYLAMSLREDLLVNQAQLSIALAAAVRWAVGRPGSDRSTDAHGAVVSPDETVAGELPAIVESLGSELDPGNASLLLGELRDALDATLASETTEHWHTVLEALERDGAL